MSDREEYQQEQAVDNNQFNNENPMEENSHNQERFDDSRPSEEPQRSGPPDTSGMFSIKIDNLPYDLSQEELKAEFESYGPIGDIFIPRDRRFNRSRGFGFVRFLQQEHANAAVEGANGKELAGRGGPPRVIRVDHARVARGEAPSGRFNDRGGRFGGRDDRRRPGDRDDRRRFDRDDRRRYDDRDDRGGRFGGRDEPRYGGYDDRRGRDYPPRDREFGRRDEPRYGGGYEDRRGRDYPPRDREFGRRDEPRYADYGAPRSRSRSPPRN